MNISAVAKFKDFYVYASTSCLGTAMSAILLQVAFRVASVALEKVVNEIGKRLSLSSQEKENVLRISSLAVGIGITYYFPPLSSRELSVMDKVKVLAVVLGAGGVSGIFYLISGNVNALQENMSKVIAVTSLSLLFSIPMQKCAHYLERAQRVFHINEGMSYSSTQVLKLASLIFGLSNALENDKAHPS